MRPWVIPAVIVFAGLCFLCSVLFMPASELLPAQVQSGSWMPGLSPVRSLPIMDAFKGIGDGLVHTFFPDVNSLDQAMTKPMHDDIPGEVRSYILYSVFLAAAMICAAVAINAVGRWDSEEKTTIPVKK